MSRGMGKSRMLLLELLLAVFIFSFCAFVCARVFFAGAQAARQSRDLARAVEVAQTAAEAFKAAETADELAWILEGYIWLDSVFVPLDDDWQLIPGVEPGHPSHMSVWALLSSSVTERDVPAHEVAIHIVRQGGLETAHITVAGVGEDPYQLTVTKLAPEVAS